MTDWLAELPGWARELLGSAPVARLGLLDDDDDPRILPITFALSNGHLWSAIDHKPKRRTEPARLRFVRRRPRVAVTVDRYSDEWEQLAWLQMLGVATVIDAGREPEALAALRDRYPQYRDRPPAGPLIRVEVARTLHWRAGPATGCR